MGRGELMLMLLMLGMVASFVWRGCLFCACHDSFCSWCGVCSLCGCLNQAVTCVALNDSSIAGEVEEAEAEGQAEAAGDHGHEQ